MNIRSIALSTIAAALLGGSVLLGAGALAAEEAVVIPPPAIDEPVSGKSETIVLAGGCFWGVQGVFQHVKGVTRAESGYAGGDASTAQYEIVGTGTTGHAESVQVTFDPSVVSLGTILQVYFSVATNPTQLNYQGPDHGTQYRGEIFTTSDAQAEVANAYIAQLDAAKVYPDKIATKVEPLPAFYPAEAYHQDYATLHPDSGYIANNDLPKIAALKQLFPGLYSETPVLIAAN